MSEVTPRLRWPYPARRARAWWDTFTALLLAQDAHVYAALEDRNLVLASSATFTWDSTLGTLSWDAALEVVSPGTGYKFTVAASSLTILDGQLAVFAVVRSARSNTTVTLAAVNTVDPTGDGIVLCRRRGSALWFRFGRAILSSGSYSASAVFAATEPFTPPAGNGVAEIVSGSFRTPARTLNTVLADDPSGARTAIGTDAAGASRPPTSHGSSHTSAGADAIPAVVAAGASGLMTGADKTKLDGIPATAASVAYVDSGDAASVATAASAASAGDAATLASAQSYADNIAQGFVSKGTARAVVAGTSLAALLGGGMTYDAGTKKLTAVSVGALGTQDGVTDLAVGDTVMVPELAGGDALYNGPYTITSLGDGSTSAAFQRAANFDSSGDIKNGSYVLIVDGDRNGSLYHLTTEGPYTLDSTHLAWVRRRINISISTSTPQPLGSATPGTSGEAADAAHVHAMPSASDVGAVALSTATTRGDIYVRGASTVERLALGAAKRILSSDGTDLVYQTIASLLADISDTRGYVLRRGASAWEAVTAKTSGYVLAGDGDDLVSQPVATTLAVDHASNRTALKVQDGPRTLAVSGHVTCDGTLTFTGGVKFDPALYAISGRTTTLTFEVVADVSAAITATVLLYDLTNAATAATLSVTSTTAGNVQTASVTLPGAAVVYELRLSHNGTTSQYLSLRGAVLRITWS